MLTCGIRDTLGFCSLNDETGTREGMSVDLCRAVAATVIGEFKHCAGIGVVFTYARAFALTIWLGNAHRLRS